MYKDKLIFIYWIIQKNQELFALCFCLCNIPCDDLIFSVGNMILNGKEIAAKIKLDLTKKVQKVFPDKKNYVWIIYLWDNKSSATYVRMKKKFGEEIWLKTEIFGQEKKYEQIENVVSLIHDLNDDKNCLWFLIQLPLPSQFEPHRAELLSLIAPDKDIDWLWWVLTWLSGIWLIDFVPATARAVVTLLKEYNLYNLKWKVITVIWQSNLSWKPLVNEFIKQWASVFSCNEYTDKILIKDYCLKSDYIISCTWCIHLLDDTFVRDDQSQVLVDVWYGYLNGKPAGDVDFQKVKDKVKYISPVPGGVWPLTVASIFENLFTIEDWLDK